MIKLIVSKTVPLLDRRKACTFHSLCASLYMWNHPSYKQDGAALRGFRTQLAGGTTDRRGRCWWCWWGSRSARWTGSKGYARMQCWWRRCSCCHAAACRSWYDWDAWRTMTPLHAAAAAAAASRRRHQRWTPTRAQLTHPESDLGHRNDVA